MTAVASGELSLRGRAGPSKHWRGMSARVVGAMIAGVGLLMLAAVICVEQW
jgi:hypothetical protein